MGNITFKRLQKSEYSSFSNEAITIFSIAVAETFGETMDNDNDIESSLNNPDSEVFAVYENDEKIGGVAIKIDKSDQCNWLDLFYIYPTKFGASPPSFTAENPVVFSEHHHPKTLKTL